ncbi:hypothetical protein LPJ79_001881 [Coemansia sp. RSA 1821]|nr:hypothetical protein LPJ79_001881 [Coemansia sp. RSA 1821]
MEAELKWLLETSIPETIQLVRGCLSKVTFVSHKGMSLQAALSSKSDSEVSGTAAISGTQVTQLSLTLPLLNPSSQGISTTIYLKRGESLALSQAQEAQSYLKSVLCKVPQLSTREDALACVQIMLSDIQQAKSILAADAQQNLMPLNTSNSEASIMTQQQEKSC